MTVRTIPFLFVLFALLGCQQNGADGRCPEGQRGCHMDIDCPGTEFCCADGCCHQCCADSDCHERQVCLDGDCVTYAECSQIASCRVSPAHAVLETGATVQLSAEAYLADGMRAPVASFDWRSSDDTIAAVGADGLVTGGGTAGSAVITATVTGCPAACQAEVGNHGAVRPGRSRVLVVDELTGTPVPGATVVVGAESPATTDDVGSAEFTIELSDSNPADVTVSKADYENVTCKEVTSSDVIIHARKIHYLGPDGEELAGGIRGTFDFDPIPCEPPNQACDVRVGLGGLSFPGSLALLAPGTLIGNPVRTIVEIGGAREELPLTEGLVMEYNQAAFKRHYTPTGVPGHRAGWGLSGKIDMADLVTVMGPIVGGEEDTVGFKIALHLLPFAFSHNAVTPGVEVVPIPKVLDVDDLNLNQMTDDFVPDYANFPLWDMTPKIPADRLLTFQTPPLPVGTYDTVLVAVGVIAPGRGFLPLGLNAGMDSAGSSGSPDGIIDEPIEVRVGEVAGRLDEHGLRRVVVALAFHQDNPGARAGQVFFVSGFDATLTASDFMLPPAASFRPGFVTLDIASLPVGTDLVQAIVSDAQDRRWHIFTATTDSIVLPVSSTTSDRWQEASLIAIDLAAPTTYQNLPDFNDTNLADLPTLVGAFSFTEVP